MRHDMLGIPAFQDNYIWLYINPDKRTGIIVDPGDGLAALNAVRAQDIQVAAIFITHHHADHTGGIARLLDSFRVPVYGPQQEFIPHVTHTLSEGETVLVPGFSPFRVLSIPGHTKGHIAFYGAGLLFCGDTLFAGGCGRLFEGTPAMLFNSLQKIKALSPETLLYCAHEYTQKNLAFALTIEPNNLNLQTRYAEVCLQRKKNQPTVPSLLSLEHATNPFLRTDAAAIISHVSLALGRNNISEVDIFTALRLWKNNF